MTISGEHDSLLKKISLFVLRVENNDTSLLNYILTFLTVIFIFFTCMWLIINPSDLIHFPSSFFIKHFFAYLLQCITLAILVISLLSAITSIPTWRIAKIVYACFSLIWLVPLQTLSYLSLFYPNHSAIHAVALFYIAIFTITMLVYLRIKHIKNILLTAIVIIPTLALIYLPIFLSSFLTSFQNSYALSFLEISNIDMLLLVPLGILLGYLSSADITIAIIKDARYLRILNYQLMLVLGFTLGIVNNPYYFKQIIFFSPNLVLNLIFCSISLCFACLYAIIINNIADVEIDTICNQDRPLVTKAIQPKIYDRLGYVFLALSLLYAYIVDSRALLLISVFIGSYYIYSLPPIRFKRVPLLSKLIFSINSIALIILGYILVNGEVEDFPKQIYFIYLFCFTVAANVVDLKDVKGDGAAGILTLPVILGERKAKLLIGVATFITYVAFNSLLNNNLALFFLISAGILQFYFINKKQYSEPRILILSNISIILLILYLGVFNNANL